MAVVWGSWVSWGSSAAQRTGAETWYEGDPASGWVRVWVRFLRENNAPISDTQTLNFSGDSHSGTGTTPSFMNGGGQAEIGRWHRDIPTQYGSTQAFTFTGTIGGHFAGANPSVSVPVTVPARPYLAPRAPKTPTLTRVSDSQQNIAWVADHDAGNGAQPWTGVIIYRADNTSGFVVLARVPWNVTSYPDTTTRADRAYTYHLYSYNAVGAGGGVNAGVIKTTPAAPTGVVAQKFGDAITVTWTDRSGIEDGYQVRHSSDGGVTWDGLNTSAAGTNGTSYTSAGANPAVTHTYQVRAYTASGLVSGWSAASNTVQLQSPPSAPINLSPSGTVVDRADGVILRWQHNPVDTTAQTKATVQYRIQGSTAWLTLFNGTLTAQEYVVPAGTMVNGGIYEWRVMTWGSHPTGSAYSDIASFTTSAKPTVNITGPASPVNTNKIQVTWSYYDAESTAQSMYRYQLWTGGQLVEERIGNGTSTVWTFETTVEDGGTYEIQVYVRDGSGLWSDVAVRTVQVSYAKPAVPSLTATWNWESGSVLLNPTEGSGGTGTLATDWFEVERSVDGANWFLVAGRVPVTAMVTDQIPRQGGVTYYRARAVSSIESSSTSPVIEVDLTSVLRHRGWSYLNAGPGFGSMVRFRDNTDVSGSSGREKVLHQFLGRDRKVEFASRAKNNPLSVSFKLGPDATSIEHIEEFFENVAAPVCYRDASGRRIFVSLGEFNYSYQNGTMKGSFNATRIDHAA